MYKLLWIDNDLQSYIKNGSVQKIKDFLIERGFEPIIESATEYIYDEGNPNDILTKHDYDLILSDYNLDNGSTGDGIIKTIRDIKRLDTDILFYSANSNYLNNANVKNNLAFIDRVTFYCGRDGLLDKIEKIIELTLKKLLEIDATRGLITAATSDLDVEIENIYNILIELPTEEELKSKVKKIFSDDYKEIKKKHIKDCKSKRDANFKADYKTYFSESDAFRKWKLLKELLKVKSFDGFDLELFQNYNTDIIGVRNKFAHAKSEEKNGKMVLRGQFGKEESPFEFNEEKCIQIRKDIIKHKKNLDKLGEICSNPP